MSGWDPWPAPSAGWGCRPRPSAGGSCGKESPTTCGRADAIRNRAARRAAREASRPTAADRAAKTRPLERSVHLHGGKESPMRVVLWDTRKLDVAKDFAGGYGVGQFPGGGGIGGRIVRHFFKRDYRPDGADLCLPGGDLPQAGAPGRILARPRARGRRRVRLQSLADHACRSNGRRWPRRWPTTPAAGAGNRRRGLLDARSLRRTGRHDRPRRGRAAAVEARRRAERHDAHRRRGQGRRPGPAAVSRLVAVCATRSSASATISRSFPPA